MKIAKKTKEAMTKLKAEQTINKSESTNNSLSPRNIPKKIKPVRVLTDEGRRKLSEATKMRWQNPEFRKNYTLSRQNCSHSIETRMKISSAVKLKWQDNDYREKVLSFPLSDVAREKISTTLKARWEDPEFRSRMQVNFSTRGVAWREQLSEKIKEKWNDPVYRASVIAGLKRTFQRANGENENITQSLVGKVRNHEFVILQLSRIVEGEAEETFELNR